MWTFQGHIYSFHSHHQEQYFVYAVTPPPSVAWHKLQPGFTPFALSYLPSSLAWATLITSSFSSLYSILSSLVFFPHSQGSQNADLTRLCHHYNTQRHPISRGIKTNILKWPRRSYTVWPQSVPPVLPCTILTLTVCISAPIAFFNSLDMPFSWQPRTYFFIFFVIYPLFILLMSAQVSLPLENHPQKPSLSEVFLYYVLS